MLGLKTADKREKFFLYSFHPVTACAVKEESANLLSLYVENYSDQVFDDIKYSFVCSVFRKNGIYESTLSFASNKEDRPFTQTVLLSTDEQVVSFVMVPYILFEIKEINCFYYHDEATLEEVNEIYRLWLMKNILQT